MQKFLDKQNRWLSYLSNFNTIPIVPCGYGGGSSAQQEVTHRVLWKSHMECSVCDFLLKEKKFDVICDMTTSEIQ